MIPKLLTGVSIVIGIVLAEAVRPFAENHPWRVTFVLAAAAVGAGLLYVALVWILEVPRGWVVPTLMLLLGSAGWGLVEGWDTRDGYLTPYCTYGANTTAERDRCLAEVRSEDVDGLDTAAARFARGELTECAAGAGRLCRDALAGD